MNPKYLSKALELAYALHDKDREELRCQHFTFVFLRDKIITIGFNQNKTHPINFKNLSASIPAHRLQKKIICSELSVFMQLKRKTNIPYNKCNLVNVRIDRDNRVRNSYPCLFCRNLIAYIQPKSLFYTNDLGAFVEYIYE